MTIMKTTADGRTFEVPSTWTTHTHLIGLDAYDNPVARSVIETRTWTMTPEPDPDRGVDGYSFAHDGPPTAEDGDAAIQRQTPGHSMLFGLTMCCGASFKGLEDGVGCRKCYSLNVEGSDRPDGEVSLFID